MVDDKEGPNMHHVRCETALWALQLGPRGSLVKCLKIRTRYLRSLEKVWWQQHLESPSSAAPASVQVYVTT
ncbi:hypothetical protein HDU90_003224 [Geranomyces variabilis]|nr:hypothetical protein HDU90_003224 [Geranomyces variabilis]